MLHLAEQRARRLLATNSIRWLRRIGSGFTNENWLIEADAQVLVLRLGNTLSSDLGIDRQREQQLLQRAAVAQLVPRVVAFDAGSGDMATVHEPGAIAQPMSPQRLASLLRSVHDLDPAGISRVDLLATLVRWHQQAVAGDVAVSSAVPEALKVCVRSAHVAVCVTHHDVNPWNCLVTNSGVDRLLDWEYGGLGDPAFDLAATITHFSFDAEAESALLSAYGADTAVRRRLPVATLLFQLREHLWAAFMLVHGHTRPQIVEQLAQSASWLEARSV